MVLWRPLCLSVPALAEKNGPAMPVAGIVGTWFDGFEKLTLDASRLTVDPVDFASAEEEINVEVFSKVRQPVAGLGLNRVRVMGIVNVTPDSFSDGGAFFQTERAVEHGLQLLAEGADILDIGGESTRPGAEFVSVEDELARVVPVIEGLRAKTDAVISIDTRKVEVMRRAVEVGASMINDVSALSFDQAALEVAAGLDVPVVLMHAQGTPQTMQDKPMYDHVLFDVYAYLAQRIEAALAAGVKPHHLIVDPGIGFGKTVRHNCELIAGLSVFHGLDVPVLLGCSRKRFIGALSGDAPVEERLGGSVAGALHGAAQGVHILRVHDVAAVRQALDVWFGLNI